LDHGQQQAIRKTEESIHYFEATARDQLWISTIDREGSPLEIESRAQASARLTIAYLETEFSRNLNPPRIVSYAVVNASENCGRKHRRRIIERRMVGQIPGVHSQIIGRIAQSVLLALRISDVDQINSA
jgi:hypothetical protein